MHGENVIRLIRQNYSHICRIHINRSLTRHFTCDTLSHPCTSRHRCVINTVHATSSFSRQPRMRISSLPQSQPDYYRLIEDELSSIPHLIRQYLNTPMRSLREISHYYFDGKGKSFRPMVILLFALSCNFHMKSHSGLLTSQRTLAVIAEMIHTASLLHDDIVDEASLRRGKPSTNCLYGERSTTLAGDYILSVAAGLLADLGNNDVVNCLSTVIDDLVRGEFMQMDRSENENERFAHYLKKTYKKTASLLAHSCQASAILGQCPEAVVQLSYEYGKNIGMAYQLIDDILDYISSSSEMGKPTSTDLSLGLATAPVLFASQQFTELNDLIARRFSQDGDAELAKELVHKSDGIRHTRFMAEKYCEEATRQLTTLENCPSRAALYSLTNDILSRSK